MSPRIIYIKLSQASILLPVFAGLINYKRLALPFKILFYFFLSTIGFEIQASVLGKLYHNNMPGLHLFTFVEFLIFSTVYYLFFKKNKTVSFLIGINAIVFVIIAIADTFSQGIWEMNTLSRSYSSASMLCYTLIYFYFMFSTDDAAYTSRHPMFWTNTGALIYFGSNMLYFLFNKDLMARTSPASYIGLYIHAALNIAANCLYAQSFRCFKKQIVL